MPFTLAGIEPSGNICHFSHAHLISLSLDTALMRSVKRGFDQILADKINAFRIMETISVPSKGRGLSIKGTVAWPRYFVLDCMHFQTDT